MFLMFSIDACNLCNYELGNINWENEKLHLNIMSAIEGHISEFSSGLDFTESILNHCNRTRRLLSNI